MDKPKKKVKEYYDWGECIKYLEEKYDFSHRDVAGKWKKGIPTSEEVPYQNYWHTICDRISGNGSFFWITNEDIEEKEPWEQTITTWILNEFSNDPEDSEYLREVEFFVSW